jgi:hypothetical protein
MWQTGRGGRKKDEDLWRRAGRRSQMSEARGQARWRASWQLPVCSSQFKKRATDCGERYTVRGGRSAVGVEAGLEVSPAFRVYSDAGSEFDLTQQRS